MKKLNTILISLLASLLIANTVSALSLSEAKQQGLVGEQLSGYLGTVKSTSETMTLVRDINAKRKQRYQDIAQRNGTDLQSVEQLAGKAALQKTKPGQFVNMGNGWKKK